MEESHEEHALPPFLLKIFEIADDPETDSIVSWNSSGTSFIIWDHNKFSESILPKYFKSNVFSSFVYQLNNYGFRKICCEIYEYANPWFQAGKKEWLKNIKRRKEKFQVPKKRGRSTLKYDSMNAAADQELQALMTEQNNMKEQIKKLKERIGKMEHQIISIKSKMSFHELSDYEGGVTDFSKQMHLEEIQDHASENGAKRPRLTELEITESEVNNEDIVEIFTAKVSSADNSGSGNSIQSSKENTESFDFLKRILEDDTWFSTEGEGNLPVDHSKAIVELARMMESYTTMDRGNLEEKASDQEMDDDVPTDLRA
ncbi:heat stress transcription factor A-2-like [Dorcoceras hygrometricum]|uniref:Heat stress transcription factor A-2-like n=1 Tax=Dorcoceras hygrometricum TaxID=472368 RepID=A0A2Z7CK86_9LAMI|nr:heat stress transcription factor A-2-like [Dorcoceras hygrometricum]